MDSESRESTVESSESGAAPVLEARTGAGTLRRRRGVAVVWAAGVVGLALFLTLGTASVQVGSRIRFRRALPLTDVWSRFVEELADGGSATLVRVGLYGATAVLLTGAALGLWLAMTAGEGDRGPRDSRRG